jgi:hypothetical protein
MTPGLTRALAVMAAVVAGACVVTAAAGASDGSPRSGAHGAGPGHARPYAGAGLRSLGHGDRGRLPGFGGGSGWYQRGFGGLRDPGWGYRFGPGGGGSFGR